ncbi:MAG: R3H domain-containing nucleic acid-binding protein [Ornithinimicrobium sp.]
MNTETIPTADAPSQGPSETDSVATSNGAVTPVSNAEGASVSKTSRKSELEREGEVAADFLETLMDIADLDGDLEVDVEGDRASVSIVDSDEGSVPRRLVGTEAAVLEALQELTRLAVQAETGERSRLMLDVGGHRRRRRAELVTVASDAVDKVKASGEAQSLDPMTAFERKVVHDEVLRAGLKSASEGEEPRRYVVVLSVS